MQIKIKHKLGIKSGKGLVIHDSLGSGIHKVILYFKIFLEIIKTYTVEPNNNKDNNTYNQKFLNFMSDGFESVLSN